MAIKFLSGLNLSNVTAGSILKLDSNGNIVAATAGTDYATTSGLWSTAGQGGVNINKDVRIGTYSSDVLPEARLHVHDFQTTDPKLLIEDGNTGDASMQFKISTQSYTMGIDNSDSDKFILAASSALGTTNAIEVSTAGVTQFGNDIKLSNGWTLSTASTSYAKFGSWVNIDNTGFYTFSNLYVDLDDSTSRFVIRSENNTEEFVGDTATDTFSIPNWSFGIGTTSPEGTLDVVGSTINGTAQADWSNDGVVYNAYGDLTVSRRHGATKDSDWGFTGPLIDFRSSNSGSEWSVAQILGTIDPLGGSNHQGGLAFLTSPGGTTNPTGRRNTGSAPQVRMLIGADGTTYMQGNVGIGSTNPSEKLHVVGNGVFHSGANLGRIKVGRSANQEIEIYVDDTNNIITAYQDSDGNSSHVFALDREFDGSGANYFEIRKGGSAQMHIDTDGKVGIGTTSPSYKLDISGNFRATSTIYANADINSNGGNILRFTVGTNAASGFTVYNAAENGYLSNRITTDAHSRGWGWELTNSTANSASVTAYHRFGYGGTAASWLANGTGNVGIGQTAPSDKLSVNGNIGINYGGYLGFYRYPGVGHTFTTDGFTSAVFGISSGVYTGRTNAGLSISGYDQIRSYTNGYERMRITTGGNVGIGTTSPSTKFSVRATTATHQLVGINRANSDTAALYLGNNSSDDAIIAANNGALSLGKDVSGTYTEYVGIATDGELKFSAYGAGILKTNSAGIVSLDTNTYLTSVSVDWDDIGSVQDSIDLNSTVQIGQGDTETIVSFQNSGTERGRFEVDSATNSYFVATGFKTTGSSTGLLKSDGTIDTSTYATSADINSFIEITDVATYLSTNNYVTTSYTGFVAVSGDTMTGNLSFNDNGKVILGTGSDFEMFHNGSNTFLQTTTSSVGDFYITARGTNHDLYLEAADDIFIRPQGNESGIDVIGNGAVKLYYNGSMKLETTDDGINVPGVSKLGATCFYSHDVGVGDADGLDIKWTLKDKDGNDVTSTTSGVVYRLRLVTLGTGTNTGAVYICDNVDGNGWRTKKVASVDGGSPNSNYPFVEIDGGVPKVTIQHNSTYNVRVFVEAFLGGNGGASYTMLGLDSGITNENGSVLMSLSSSTTEATSVMIGADNILRKRELGSLAFNSTTLGTAASSAATDFVAVSGDTMTGDLTVKNSNSATSVLIGNSGTGVARTYFDASNGDFAGSDYMWIGQNNDLSGEIVMTQSAGAFHIKTQPSGTVTSRLTVLQNGNVGIGTTSPAQKLDVVGKMKISDDIILAQTNGRLDYDNGVSTGALRFWSTSANAERVRISSAGNVGIGTTNPGFKLEVNGTTRLGDTATEYTRFGTYGALLSTDTHILHNMLWTGSWTQIDATKSSSTIYMGSSSDNTIKFGYAGTSDTTWSYYHTFENDGDYTAAGVIKGYNSVRVDSAATGSPYFGLYQGGGERAYLQYVDSGDNLVMQSDGMVTIRGDVQNDQQSGDPVISFKQSATELAKIDQEGNVHAGGFKVSGTTGFLKSDGSVDINTYANAANFLALSGGTMTGDLTIPSKIIHSGDTNTYFLFSVDKITLTAGGYSGIAVESGLVKSQQDFVITGGETFALGERAEGDDNGRTVLIEGAANAGNGEGSGRIFFSEHNSTSAAADSYGLSLYYEGDGNAALPSGFQPNTGNATWSLRRHDNSVNGTPIFFGSRGNSNVTFEGTLSVPEYIYHRGDANTYIRLLTDRIQIVAGGSTKFDSNNTYLISSADISVRNITARDIVSAADRTYSLGTDANRWAVVYCETLDSAGQHESNLQDEEQPISQYETGTVLSWKDGKNRPCTQYADHMRMGIAVHGQDSPLIQGAEPVLCTGVVEEGDYLVTSDKEGHAVAVPRNIVKEQMLFDCVIGKALENGDGESHLVKTWINI